MFGATSTVWVKTTSPKPHPGWKADLPNRHTGIGSFDLWVNQGPRRRGAVFGRVPARIEAQVLSDHDEASKKSSDKRRHRTSTSDEHIGRGVRGLQKPPFLGEDGNDDGLNS